MISPLFVSFHTGGNYERHAAELAETLTQFGLEYEIDRMPCTGVWCSNCAMKSTFIAQKMDEHPFRPLVWLDADARVRKHPEMLLNMGTTIDFAAHKLDGVELLSGTLYFGGTQSSVDLASAWRRRCVIEPNVWDQIHLSGAVDAMPQLNVVYLPESYTRIFDRSNLMERSEIVVEHLQASRQEHG